MQYISFINRHKEISLLKELGENFFLVLMGRRRIGKTRLLRETFPSHPIFFVWPDKSIEWMMNSWCEEYSIPEFKRFEGFLNYLLDQLPIVVFDEFQNFYKTNKTLLGTVQKVLDDRKFQGKKYRLIVSGSSYSTLRSMFNSPSAALYNRKTHLLVLDQLEFIDLYNAFEIDLERLISLWGVFGGVPYYYEIINLNNEPIDEIVRLFISQSALLVQEGNNVISMEFSTDSKTYKTILSLIAQGKNELHELVHYFDDKKGNVTKYLEYLRKEFNLVSRETPILESPRKSKKGRYIIKDNLLNFWFQFIDKKLSYIEQGRYKELEEIIRRDFSSYIGMRFEKLIMHLARRGFFGEYKSVGRQWGTISGAPPGKNQYEIDLVGINQKNKTILFGECKWRKLDRKITVKIISDLKTKSNFIKWERETRKERFIIFAKEFPESKEEIEKTSHVSLFDLNDLEDLIKEIC